MGSEAGRQTATAAPPVPSPSAPVRSSPRGFVPEEESRAVAQGAAGNLAIGRAFAASGIRAKLTVSQPGDPEEDEADRVADAVVSRSPIPMIQRKCDACSDGGTPCADCEEEKLQAHSHLGSALPLIQRSTGRANGMADKAPASVGHVLAGSGRPMDPELRQDMERRFGHDLSLVRVHSGGAAEQSAREVNAHAYTVGQNIVFGAGQFAPGTREGQRLIAHELTHVVQRRAMPMVQREPACPSQETRTPSGAAPTDCKPWPAAPAMQGESGRKPAGRDSAIEYALAVTPGHFCDTPRPSVALLQYKRKVWIRTASGHEAILCIEADASYYGPPDPSTSSTQQRLRQMFLPAFDPKKSDFEQLRALGHASMRWSVSVKYSEEVIKKQGFDYPQMLMDWGPAKNGAGRAAADPQSLDGLAKDNAPSFADFFLPPEHQQQKLESFVEQRADADMRRQRRFEEWLKKQPPVEPQTTPVPPPAKRQPKQLDDAEISNMSEGERFDLAREQIWERTKANLKHMWENPVETLKGFAKGAILLDTPEIFSAIGEDLTELLDSDANAWSRAAAGVGAASKASGWLAGLLGGLLAILYVASWFVGIGELATLFAAAAILFGASLALSGVGSVLRAKGASKAKTAADFNHNVDAGAAALTNGIVGAAMIAALAVLHATVKVLVPEATQQRIKTFFEEFRKRLKTKGGTKTAPPSPQPATPAPKPAVPPEPPKPAVPTEPPKPGVPTEPPESAVPTEPKADQEPTAAPTDPQTLKKKSARDIAREETEKKIQEIDQKKRGAYTKIDKLKIRIEELKQTIRRLEKTVENTTGQEQARAAKELEQANNELNENKGGGLVAEREGTIEELAELDKKKRNLVEALKLERPSIIKSTERAIVKQAEAENLRLDSGTSSNLRDGSFLDPNTRQPITDTAVIGHKYGLEHRRLALEAQKRGMNQSQFNDWCNRHPEWFQIESKASNESHQFEKPGIDDGLDRLPP